MNTPATQIYVASHAAHELIVVAPAYTLIGTIFIAIGLLILLGGCAVLFFLRMGFARPVQMLMWLLPVLVGGPFLIVGIIVGASSTRVTLSSDTGTLSVRKTILSLPVNSRVYPLTQVRSVQVGVGNVCRFLYVNLVDRQSETLLGCTDRTGYSEVAGSINEFLEANRL